MDISNLEKFKRKIGADQTAYGCHVSSHDSSVSELVADAGYDFVWLDMEHAAMTMVDAMHHVVATRGTDCCSFIRVPWNASYLIKPVLDLAPAGVIIPMVNTAAEAVSAVKACRYPMDGGERGFALRRNNRYGQTPLSDYLEKSRSEPMVIIQIEHKDAVKNIDEILQVQGIDSVCIGPFDLSCSYNKPGQFDDAEVADAIDEIREKTLKTDVLLGGLCMGPFWQNRFMHWKTLAGDSGLLYNNLVRLLKNQAPDLVSN